MDEISLVILAAGSSTRFNLPCKKQWLYSKNEPFWLVAAKNLAKCAKFKEIFIVSNEIEYMSRFSSDFTYIKGGKTRQESLKNAILAVKTPWVMTSDSARICTNQELVNSLLSNIDKADCIVPAIKCSDSVVFGDDYINRDELKLLGTPQLSRTKLLLQALNTKETFNDDSAALKALGAKIIYVKGDENAFKLTFSQDLKKLNLQGPSNLVFSGHGFDVHKFKDGNFVMLCGEKIPYTKGILAHSDGDAPLHALCDALFGASGLGDIGEFFPDNDEKYKNISSLYLLQNTANIIRSYGFEIINVDITILAQKPKITPYKSKMCENIAQALNINKQFVNIKATTMEKMGFIGQEEGFGAIANANVKYFDWTNLI